MEIARCYVIFKHTFMSYVWPLYEHHIKLGKVDKASFYKNYYWDDASKVADYYDYVMRRIGKYGLHWSILNPNKVYNYKKMIQEEEDNLVDYFIYEMRKKPAEAAKLDEIPK